MTRIRTIVSLFLILFLTVSDFNCQTQDTLLVGKWGLTNHLYKDSKSKISNISMDEYCYKYQFHKDGTYRQDFFSTAGPFITNGQWVANSDNKTIELQKNITIIHNKDTVRAPDRRLEIISIHKDKIILKETLWDETTGLESTYVRIINQKRKRNNCW